jgi:hypothetical protein
MWTPRGHCPQVPISICFLLLIAKVCLTACAFSLLIFLQIYGNFILKNKRGKYYEKEITNDFTINLLYCVMFL